jgi:hypothetical protein
VQLTKELLGLLFITLPGLFLSLLLSGRKFGLKPGFSITTALGGNLLARKLFGHCGIRFGKTGRVGFLFLPVS